MRRAVALLSLTVGLIQAGCSGGPGAERARPTPQPARVPTVSGPLAADLKDGEARAVRLSNGAEIWLQNRAGKTFFLAEGALTEEAYTRLSAFYAPLGEKRRAELLKQELGEIVGDIEKLGAVSRDARPEVGYFTFLLPYENADLFAALKGMALRNPVVMSPVVYDRDSLAKVRDLTPAREGLEAVKGGPRAGSEAFSGLAKMGAPEFVRIAEAAIGSGAKVDGSSVRIGITDTGITYNHPTFTGADGQSRIVYMRDFTREGRVYFSLDPTAKLQVTKPEGAAVGELSVAAKLILTPRNPSLPAGDDLKEVSGLRIKVSPELEAQLVAGADARLGALLEDSLNAEDEAVDLNANGKKNDLLPIILVLGDTPANDTLYFDAVGAGDFTIAPPLKDWNTSGLMQPLFAEKIGFDVRNDELPSMVEGKIAVRSASIVGYDPGNHGSHVAGIAAGRKTIANDADDTLARGVAPNSKILMNRVCANNGGCAALDALIDVVLEGKADVVNMSLGGLNPFNDGYGVQETIINRLTAVKSALFSISAGNEGPSRQTVGSPSVARLSMSVGAAASTAMIQRQYQWPASGERIVNPEDDREMMLFFSSRGPTAAGGFKPNLAAPGTELSSVQLNAAKGARAGLDVYWGTSMAAPAATGAYALLLDGVRKYNLAHPDQKLAEDALTLRQVLIDSARAFDVRRFDPSTGEKLQGQYTWLDEGKGMLNLPAAWAKLVALRDQAEVPAAVQLEGQPVKLDYEVVVSQKNPTGASYDGTRPGDADNAIFGTGIYLDYYADDTLRGVSIRRKLPEGLAASAAAGELTRQLVTSQDEFVFKTIYYGSDVEWLKVGTLESLPCWESDTEHLTLLGMGAQIASNADGTAVLSPNKEGTLNVCVNREAISKQLAPGDHGALIEAYRTAGGKVESIPSFTVPVSVTVPHHILKNQLSYDIKSVAKSFSVSRNYVRVPKGTTVVRVRLEVPSLKESGGVCAGVELMARIGGNTMSPLKSRAEARIANCDARGKELPESRRRLDVTVPNPVPGIWDLHVFGSYQYAASPYSMKVDYVVSTLSKELVEGGLEVLSGELGVAIRESSVPVTVSAAKSKFVLSGLKGEVKSKVAQGESVIVAGPLGKVRAYPEGTQRVTITTGGSTGNDIDLVVLSCASTATEDDLTSCKPLVASGGATDVESASFVPKTKYKYVVRVDGYEVKNNGDFVSGELLELPEELGALEVKEQGSGAFAVQFSLSGNAEGILKNPLFLSRQYLATPVLTLRSDEGLPLGIVNFKVQAPEVP